MASETTKGYLYAIAAYLSLGLLPAYWKLLHELPSFEILMHRILWSFVFCFFLILQRKSVVLFLKTLRAPRILIVYLFSALLIGTNWYIFIEAVNTDRVLEASLGYYINPLVSLFLGMVLLGEKLRRLQWFAVFMAAAGVFQMTTQSGSIPWSGLTLAFSFGLYGLIRKKAPLDSLVGSTLENLFLAAPALVFLVAKSGSFGQASFLTHLLLVASGVATALPLLWFSEAAKRLPLSRIGFVQFLGPSISFLLAVFAFGEVFTELHLRSFICIWLAVLIFVVDEQLKSRKARRLKAATA